MGVAGMPCASDVALPGMGVGSGAAAWGLAEGGMGVYRMLNSGRLQLDRSKAEIINAVKRK
jgi:hypothetical protein